MYLTEKATMILLAIIFIVMMGIAGKCDADNAMEIEKEKQELQEYLGEEYEIN
jgi:hypothetical protein